MCLILKIYEPNCYVYLLTAQKYCSALESLTSLFSGQSWERTSRGFKSSKSWGFGDPKRFSDLAENWLILGSDDIKLFKFGTFWISFFPTGKKSDLLSNLEILSQIPYGEERFFSGLYKSCWNSTRASLVMTTLPTSLPLLKGSLIFIFIFLK